MIVNKCCPTPNGPFIDEAAFPEQFAVLDVRALEAVLFLGSDRLGHEDPFAVDDGGGVSRLGQPEPPTDILSLSPFEGEAIGAGRTRSGEVTAPDGPCAFCLRGVNRGEGSEQQKRERFHRGQHNRSAS